jgi:hypothetical protein
LSIFPDRATDGTKKTVIRISGAAANARGRCPDRPQKPRFRHDLENRLFGVRASVANSIYPMLDGGSRFLYT